MAICAVLLLAGGLCGLAGAGALQTGSSRLSGAVALGDGAVIVGSASVPLASVLYAITDVEPAMPADSALRLVSGEIWAGGVQAVSAGQCTVSLGPAGTRQIDTGYISAIDFAPNLPAPAGGEESVLHRRKSESVPGTLMWVDGREVCIDSLLGVLTLGRETCTRYVFPASAAKAMPASAPANPDELGLADGSVFRGRVALASKNVELDHPLLGKVRFPSSAVRYLLRGDASATFLADLAPAKVQAASLIGLPDAPQTVTVLSPRQSPVGKWTQVRSIRIEPRTTLRYKLPGPDGSPLMLRGALAADSRAKGSAIVRISVGGVKQLQKELLPAGEPSPLELPAHAGDELEIEVEFGGKVAFPCAAVLLEPLLTPRAQPAPAEAAASSPASAPAQ
jgi:hypothetical protein